MSSSGAKAAKTSSRCGPVSRERSSSSWLRRNVTHLPTPGHPDGVREGLRERFSRLPRECEEDPRVEHEVEEQVQPVGALR